MKYLKETQLELAQKLKKKSPVELPWKSEKLLFSDKYSSILEQPFIKDNSIYFVDNSNRIVKISLKDYSITKSRSYEVNNGFTKCVHMGDKYFFIAGSKSIVGLPINGGDPISIETKGLPSQEIQSMGEVDGTLYIGLGKKLKEGYLVRYALSNKSFELISSSFHKQGESLFAHESAHAYFSHMVKDWKRNRLLIYVHYGLNVNPQFKGLWSVDAKGEFTQIAKLWNYPDSLNFTDEDNLIVSDSWYSVSVNLSNQNLRLLKNMGASKGSTAQGEKQVMPIYPMEHSRGLGILIGDQFLTETPFATTSPGKKPKLLSYPENIKEFDSNDRPPKLTMLALTPDKNAVIYATNSKIILLNLKDGK